jgi:hypothetical protein
LECDLQSFHIGMVVQQIRSVEADPRKQRYAKPPPIQQSHYFPAAQTMKVSSIALLSAATASVACGFAPRSRLPFVRGNRSVRRRRVLPVPRIHLTKIVSLVSSLQPLRHQGGGSPRRRGEKGRFGRPAGPPGVGHAQLRRRGPVDLRSGRGGRARGELPHAVQVREDAQGRADLHHQGH